MGNKDLAAGTDEEITDELLSPCASRYRCLEKEANDTPGAVRRLSRLGQLDGLTVFGCFDHTKKEGGPTGVCKECHKCLEKKGASSAGPHQGDEAPLLQGQFCVRPKKVILGTVGCRRMQSSGRDKKWWRPVHFTSPSFLHYLTPRQCAESRDASAR